MKNIIVLSLLIVATNLFAQTKTDHDFDQIICKEMEAHQHHMQPPPPNNPLTENYDLKYYRFEWYVDPAVYFIEGSVTVYFQAMQENFTEINFDFSSQLIVSNINYHGQSIGSTASGDYLLTIPLPVALPAGTIDSLTINYSGIPPSGGFGSFIQSEHEDIPVIWTLSEPFGSQDWWPCKNGLDDKIDSIDIIVTTPAAYRVAGNGSLVQESTQGTNKVYHWQHRYPIAPYLVAIGVTNYAQYTDNVPLSNGTQLPMLNYVYPEDLEAAQTGTADLVQVLQFYDSLFVTYPFHEEKYGHAQFGWGGGMEHQTMSFVVSYGWGLLSHELAHQWFGDMVTCGSWEDIWLNEGFATYLEGLTRERFDTYLPWYDWKLSKINSVISQPDGSVKVDDTTSVSRIFSGRLSYNKGAYLLNMLRWKLGDEVFFPALRYYLNDLQFGYAKTPALKAHLEAASGIDLTEFFEDWYEGQGFPSYQLYWEQIGNLVYLKPYQTTSHPSVDFYEMPLPVVIKGTGNEIETRLENTFNGELFEIHLPFVVTSVQFDPDLRLLSGNNSVHHSSGLDAIDELADGSSVLIFPNPTQDYIQVFFENKKASQNFRWKLINSLGQEVKTGLLDQGNSTIDISLLSAGIYRFLIMDTEGKIMVREVVKS